MKTLCCGILLLTFFAVRTEGLYKKWLWNTDLNNPYNWDSGRIPCGNDRMVIPDDSPVVFLQMNTTIQELVLPGNGELVFGGYATLAFTNDPDHSASCLDSGIAYTIPSLESTFNASHPEAWLDPRNWCPTDTEQGTCKDLPLLHTEQVPCSTDNVVFPTGSSYYVNLGANLNIEINTLKVSGRAYSQSTFRDYLSTDTGRSVFPPPSGGSQSTVVIHKRRCTDMTGCGCGNDQGQLMEAVCSIQRSRCRRLGCSVGVRPVGHCCNICGGMINVTFGVGFDFNTLKNALQRNFLDGKADLKDVQYIVSKRSDGKIQIILKDEDGAKSSQVAKAMFTEINKDVNNGGIKYSVTGVTMATSTAGSSGNNSGSTSAHTGGGGAGSRGKVAGIVIGTIIGLCILAAIGLFLYRRKTTDEESSGFGIFNKFSLSPERRPNLPSLPSIAFSWGPWGSRDSGLSSVGGNSQGFENPAYGSTPLEDMKSMELELTAGDFSGLSEEQPIGDRGFDNPLYDNVQETFGTDPSAPEKENVMTIGGTNLDDDDQFA